MPTEGADALVAAALITATQSWEMVAVQSSSHESVCLSRSAVAVDW